MAAIGDSVAALDPTALSSARLLVAARIDGLVSQARRLEARLGETAESRSQLREQLHEAEVAWGHVVKNISRFGPQDVDTALQRVAGLRADKATLDARSGELSASIAEVHSERENLQAIGKSLDELSSTYSEGAADNSSRARNASRQVFQLIEEERMRIARDMHDGPAQSMANLVLQAEILERLFARDPELVIKELADFKRGVRAILDETRRLIFDLRPMTLDDLGLVPTLRKFVKEYAEKNVPTRLRIVGEERRLPGNYEPTLFRIIQEALANARKHARAHAVEVTVTFQSKRVATTVRDDGVGFSLADIEGSPQQSLHLGLTSMRERANLERGTLEITSEIGHGTEVRVVFDV